MTVQFREPIQVAGVAGANAAMRIAGATTSGHPTTGTWQVGDVVIDESGLLWLCYSVGPPYQWAAFPSTVFQSPISVFNSTTLPGPGISITSAASVTLPPAVAGLPVTLVTTGGCIVFSNEGGTVTIDGKTSDTLPFPGQSRTYVCTGAAWNSIAQTDPLTREVNRYPAGPMIQGSGTSVVVVDDMEIVGNSTVIYELQADAILEIT